MLSDERLGDFNVPLALSPQWRIVMAILTISDNWHDDSDDDDDSDDEITKE